MEDATLQDTAVRVAVRVRPLIPRELVQGSLPCISTDGPCVTVGRDRRFTFDHAFGPNSQQDQVYEELVGPLVESCFDGFNVTVLAYGQTGSGKTFTMGTGECRDEEQMGIAPRVIRHVFRGIAARRQQAAFYVRAQFLEIYNEDVKDLLMPPAEQAVKWVSRDQSQAAAAAASGPGITLRDAGDGTIMVIGAVEEPAECAEDLLELLERGMALRATSSTCANEQSSRSHAILTIILEQHVLAGASVDGSAGGAASEGGAASAAGEVRTAKLHLVDLAGSERTKQLLRSSMQGPRFRETVNINQGLLALGNVISALGDERRRGAHVPYRESKLTRLLQDSLGGNSRTAMIACISPADEVLEETLNTLKYANRAKNIRNKPVINRVLPASSQSPLCGAVREVQLQVLQQLAAQLAGAGGPLAQELPLGELMALEAADTQACLDVLTRMRSTLGSGSRGGSADAFASITPLALRKRSLGAAPTDTDPDVEALVSGYSGTIAGILQSLAEMEAQGHVDKEAREHILRALDASSVKLLPVVKSGGGGAACAGSAASDDCKQGQDSRERERQLEERIRSLEAELSSCRADLKEARDDLERDEIIFADKLKELEDAQVASSEAKERLAETKERHAKEVADLRKQLADLTAQVAQQQAARPAGPARASSRTRVRRQSGSEAPTAAAGPLRRRSSSDRVTGDDKNGRGGDGSGSERGAEEDEVLYDEELLSYISETDYTEQHRREVLESDASLREELAEVLREKAAAEAERAAVERSALAQRSSFDAARAALEQQLTRLSSNIAKQQEELQAAQAAEKEARGLAAQWQERARELESAIEAREEALSRMRAELEAVESNAARSGEERAALRQQYEQRIAAVVAQVSTLQRQLQQHASSGVAERRERQLSAERMADTEAELNRLRGQQADLRKQLSERMARYERESAARVRELAALRKAAAAARSRMQALEQENRAQRALLREKQLAVMAAEQRLRDQQRSTTGGGRSRSSSPGSRSYRAPGGSGGMSSSSQSNYASSGEYGAALASLGGGGKPAPALRGSVPGSLGRAAGPGPGPGPAAGRRAFSPGRPTPQTPITQARGPTARSSLPQLQDAATQDEDAGPRIAGVSQPPASAAGDPKQVPEGGLDPQQPPMQRPLDPEQQGKAGEWAEELLAVVSEAAAVEARLEVLASRQREVLERRDTLTRERAQFGLRTKRRAEQLAQEVAACDAELAELVGRIPSPRYDTPPSSAPCTPRDAEAAAGVVAAAGAGNGAGPAQRGGGGGRGFNGSGALLSDEWVALQQRIADVSHTKATLEGRLRSGRLLDDREQQIMDLLEDQLEDLETQLAVVAGEAADRRAALAQLLRRRDQLQQRTAGMGPEGLRLVLSAATDAVGQRAYQVRRLEAALAASEAGAARQAAQLQVRLRESLVSLSAHLASLEASPSGSPVCMNSEELRDLLSMYLDFDPAGNVPAGQAPGQDHGQGLGQPAGEEEPRTASAPLPSVATQEPLVTAAAARAATATGSRQRVSFAADSHGAPAKSGTGATAFKEARATQQPTADGAVFTLRPASASSDLALAPHSLSDFTGSLATWGSHHQDDQTPPESCMALESLPVSPRSKDCVDLSLRDLPHGSPRRAAAPPPPSHQGPNSNGSSSCDGSGDGRDAAGGQAARCGSGAAGGGPYVVAAREGRGLDLVAACESALAAPDLPASSRSTFPAPFGSGGIGGPDDTSEWLRRPPPTKSTPGDMHTAQQPSAAHTHHQQADQQPQHRQQHSGSWRTGFGAVGSSGSSGGGILRRAGSMDSVGSSTTSSSCAAGSGGAAKRVTWGMPHAAAGHAAGSEAPASLAAGGQAANGGQGVRPRERSILDRADGVSSMTSQGTRAALYGGSSSGGIRGMPEMSELAPACDRADYQSRVETASRAHAERAQTNVKDDAGQGRAEQQQPWLDDGSLITSNPGGGNRAPARSRRESSSGSGSRGGPGGGEPSGAQVFRSSAAATTTLLAAQPSSSVDSGGLDDTVADTDAGRSSAAEAAGALLDRRDSSGSVLGAAGGSTAAAASSAKPGPRSFNPWRSSSCAGAGKQPRRAAAAACEQQQQQPQHHQLSGWEEHGFEGQGMGGSQSGRRCVSDGGEDDLLVPQDSDSLLRSEGEESALSLGLRDQPALPDRRASGQGLWLEPSREGGGGAAGGPNPQSQVQPQRHTSGTLPRGAAVEPGRAEDWGRYGGVTSEGGVGYGGRGSVATTAVDDDEEDADADVHLDEELEEHVRLLAQAAAVARQVSPQKARAAARVTPGGTQAVQEARRPGDPPSTSPVVAPLNISDHNNDNNKNTNSLDDDIRSEEALPLTAVIAATSPPPARRHAQGPRPTRGGIAGWTLTAAAEAKPQPVLLAQRPVQLRGPARSISPSVQNHYGRVQQQQQQQQQQRCEKHGPGPFTTPQPAILATQLAEALMPYKAHLRRSSAAGAGGTPVLGRAGAAADARHGATPGGRPAAGGVSQRQPNQNQNQNQNQQQHQQHDAGLTYRVGPDGGSAVTGMPRAMTTTQQQQSRANTTGSALPASAGHLINRINREEGQVAGTLAARQRGYLR